MSVHFIENIHCFTDQVGDPDKYNPVIGFYSDSEHKYYNLDEVKELYGKNQTSNVFEDKNKLCLKENWLTYHCPITISCGMIANNVDDRYRSLVDYCYTHHICYDSPKQVNMICGIKVLEYDSQGKKCIRYSINDYTYNEMDDTDRSYFKKIAQGKMNKLRYKYTKLYKNRAVEKKYMLMCDNVEVDSRNVIIYGISDESFQSESFIHAIQELDLQVWMNRYHFVNFRQLFHAAQIEYANRGHSSKLKYITQEDSDIYWFNHPYEHEIK